MNIRWKFGYWKIEKEQKEQKEQKKRTEIAGVK